MNDHFFFLQGLLIASHLSSKDLLDVHLFLCYNDILDLSINSYMESLVIWQEVFLISGRSAEEGFSTPIKKRWFLLIIGKVFNRLLWFFSRLSQKKKPAFLKIRYIENLGKSFYFFFFAETRTFSDVIWIGWLFCQVINV